MLYGNISLSQISEASKSLSPDKLDEYVTFLSRATVVSEGFEYVKAFFHNLAPDHELQVLTNGLETYPYGIGDEYNVQVPQNKDQLKAELNELLAEFKFTSLPIYLVHNHPEYQDTFDTLPSPSDMKFFATVERLTQGRIKGGFYANSTDTLTVYP